MYFRVYNHELSSYINARSQIKASATIAGGKAWTWRAYMTEADEASGGDAVQGLGGFSTPYRIYNYTSIEKTAFRTLPDPSDSTYDYRNKYTLHYPDGSSTDPEATAPPTIAAADIGSTDDVGTMKQLEDGVAKAAYTFGRLSLKPAISVYNKSVVDSLIMKEDGTHYTQEEYKGLLNYLKAELTTDVGGWLGFSSDVSPYNAILDPNLAYAVEDYSSYYMLDKPKVQVRIDRTIIQKINNVITSFSSDMYPTKAARSYLTLLYDNVDNYEIDTSGTGLNKWFNYSVGPSYNREFVETTDYVARERYFLLQKIVDITAEYFNSYIVDYDGWRDEAFCVIYNDVLLRIIDDALLLVNENIAAEVVAEDVVTSTAIGKILDKNGYLEDVLKIDTTELAGVYMSFRIDMVGSTTHHSRINAPAATETLITNLDSVFPDWADYCLVVTKNDWDWGSAQFSNWDKGQRIVSYIIDWEKAIDLPNTKLIHLLQGMALIEYEGKKPKASVADYLLIIATTAVAIAMAPETGGLSLATIGALSAAEVAMLVAAVLTVTANLIQIGDMIAGNNSNADLISKIRTVSAVIGLISGGLALDSAKNTFISDSIAYSINISNMAMGEYTKRGLANEAHKTQAIQEELDGVNEYITLLDRNKKVEKELYGSAETGLTIWEDSVRGHTVTPFDKYYA